MRTFVLALGATLLIAGCNPSSGGTSHTPTTGGGAAVVSCDWGIDACDQYGGALDASFTSALGMVCDLHGVAFATAECPAANQVPGHCDLGTSNGVTNSYFYYSPTYDAASARADCEGHGVGAAWIP